MRGLTFPAWWLVLAGVCAGAQDGAGPLRFGGAHAEMTRLFTPAAAPSGLYTAHRLPEPIEAVAARLRTMAGVPEGWTLESLAPIDAFGSDAPYDRARLARLYGASRPRVARGALPLDGCRAAVTLVSPYPDVTLSTLDPGTLAIVYRVGRHLEGCGTGKGDSPLFPFGLQKKGTVPFFTRSSSAPRTLRRSRESG